jgi:hypothetical protein
MPELDRRTFLAVSGLALAGVATGCTSGGDDPQPSGPPSINDIITESETRKRGRLQVIQAVGEVLTRPDARVTFALINAAGTARLTGGTMRVYAAIDDNAPAQGPVEATYHDEGLGEKGIYVVRLNFDKPGNWTLMVVGKPEEAAGELYGRAAFPGVDRVSGPAPGAKAISVPTPTADDHKGVEPYCTRVDSKSNYAPCSMHRISLDVALANGKPTVFNIGTPKFCQSRVCGPVVDVIQAVSAELGNRVNFVHAEALKDDKADTVQRQLLAPAPTAWGLSEEPITYWIKSDGTITERVVGPIDVPEVRDLTNALVG